MKGLWIVGFAFASTLFANTIELGHFAVDSRSSILFANMDPSHPDAPNGPLFIDLDQLAKTFGLGDSLVGYHLQLAAEGTMCYFSNPDGTCNVVPTEGFLAAFDANTLWSPGLANPLLGAVAPASAWESAYPKTFYDQLSTSGGAPNMMIFNEIYCSVIVPGGSHYLAVGLYDSFFRDNIGNLSIELSVALDDIATPEPATALLFLLGLSLLAAPKLLRRIEAGRRTAPARARRHHRSV